MMYNVLLEWLTYISTKRVYRSRYYCLGAIECAQKLECISDGEAEQLKRQFDCWNL